MNLIPEDLIIPLINSLNTNKGGKNLKTNSFFKLLLFSILSSERLSLRIKEDNFKEPIFKALVSEIET